MNECTLEKIKNNSFFVVFQKRICIYINMFFSDQIECKNSNIG